MSITPLGELYVLMNLDNLRGCQTRNEGRLRLFDFTSRISPYAVNGSVKKFFLREPFDYHFQQRLDSITKTTEVLPWADQVMPICTTFKRGAMRSNHQVPTIILWSYQYHHLTSATIVVPSCPCNAGMVQCWLISLPIWRISVLFP